MVKAEITKVKDNVTDKLNGMIDRSKSMQSFLVRNIYPVYKNMQMERWQTEGGSQGMPWESLSSIYAKRKKKLYGSYPGGGEKMMIATGRLFGAVYGPGSGMPDGEQFHRMVSTNNSITITLDANQVASKKKAGTEYFKYANKNRAFMKFSQESIGEMRTMLKEYISSMRRTF